MHGIRRVIGTLTRKRTVRDNNGEVIPGDSQLPRRCGILGGDLSGFFRAGIRLAYSRGKGKGVDVPFTGRRRLRHVVRLFSHLGD